MTSDYPQIGETVSFLRADEQGAVTAGNGIVQAIHLDPRKRIMVLVKEGDEAHNVDIMTINWTEDTREDYEKCLVVVAELTSEGNELVRKTVDAYNVRVKDTYNGVLGHPVEIEPAPTLEDVAGEKETEH